ncbi:VCBS repeat-containing protein [bacterium]|nr:MAG: VCBS repeat-containing protein [bacterium]
MNGVWKAPGPDFASRFSNLSLRSFGIGTVGKQTIRSKPAFEEVDNATYLSGLSSPSSAFLHGGTPRVPRTVDELDRTSPTYKRILSAFLVRKGVANPAPNIRQLIRADLDGDGTKEVIIEARSRDDFKNSPDASEWNASDYSIVLLRSMHGKEVREFSLEFVSKQVSAPLDIRRLRAVADIDGDGRMEIVTDSSGFEWQSGTLWKYRKGVVTKVVSSYGGH